MYLSIIASALEICIKKYKYNNARIEETQRKYFLFNGS
jgi:hypothetical protein